MTLWDAWISSDGSLIEGEKGVSGRKKKEEAWELGVGHRLTFHPWLQAS